MATTIDMKSPISIYDEKHYDTDDKMASDASSFDSDSVDDLSLSKEGLLAQELRGDDLESLRFQKEKNVPLATAGVEYTVSTRTKLVYLAGYFALNLLLTIYNKAVLGGVSKLHNIQ